MSIGTAVSVGVGLLKHRQEIGAALSGLNKMTGAGFTHLLQNLHLPGGLTRQIDHALNNIDHSVQDASKAQVLAGLRYFDANQDGQISKDELSQGLDKLKTSGQDKSAEGLLRSGMGNLLLKNYAQVAQLDGNSNGISATDALKLASGDGQSATLSAADWRQLSV